MKLKLLLSSCLVATAAAAAESGVPADFLGTWAVTTSNCSLKNASTLRITEAGVEHNSMHGRINAGASPNNKSIEVVFLTPAGRAKSQNIRTYKLTVDGLKLLELEGDRVVATRVRCEKTTT